MKTIRDLALEIGVSKVAVQKKIEKLNLKNDLIKRGNKLLIPDSVEYALKSAFNYANDNKDDNESQENENNRVNYDNSLQTVIEVLRTELEEKNKQIDKLQTIINQEQQLRMVTEQKLIAIEQKREEENANQEQKRGFFSRIFGSKPKENANDTDNALKNEEVKTDQEQPTK